MRGEYVLAFNAMISKIGSPPHAWRILFGTKQVDQVKRITSTCVENTYGTNRFVLAKSGSPPHAWRIPLDLIVEMMHKKDHLHMRGEYNKERGKMHWDTGSPPHAWRIPVSASVKGLGSGITSTCVENTWIN